MKKNYVFGLSPEGFHKIVYKSYGEKDLSPLVCIHGLTRNSVDFHFLGEFFQASHYVLCPDMVGRGESDWFQDPIHYTYEQYLSDLTVLFSKLPSGSFDYIGTSMGGLLGIILASLPNSPIRRLILNDVGPVVTKEVADRIRLYAGTEYEFKNFQEADSFAHLIYAPFGQLEKDQWDFVIKESFKQTETGAYALTYDARAMRDVEGDPRFLSPSGDVLFWQFWDKIKCPVFVIHGKESDVLTEDVILEMRTRGPSFEYYGVERAGHAPWLADENLLTALKEWIEKPFL